MLPEAPISASLLYDLVECEHRAWLDVHGDPTSRDRVSDFVAMLWRRGMAHEEAVLARMPGPMADLRAAPRERALDATMVAVGEGAPIILGGRLECEGMRGDPDILLRAPGGYRAGDVKLGAGEEGSGRRKLSYGVQVAHYARILEALGLSGAGEPFIIDVNGVEIAYPLDQPLGSRGPDLGSLHSKTLRHARNLLAGAGLSRPALCAACKLCHWRSACRSELHVLDDLTLVPQLGRAVRAALEPTVRTMAELAAIDVDALERPFPGVGLERLRRFAARAALLRAPNSKPYALSPLGLARRDREVFFDIEADPGRNGLVYLQGMLVRTRAASGDEERFHCFFAKDVGLAAERDAFAAAFEFLDGCRDAPIYYWSKYERTAYRALQERHPSVCSVGDIEELFDPARAIDLYFDVVLKATEWPANDYGIKTLAKLCGFSWRDVDPSGASSIEWFDRWARTGDPALRDRIILYNEDDCVATRVLFDRLLDLPIRPA